MHKERTQNVGKRGSPAPLCWKDVRETIQEELRRYERHLPLWNTHCPLWIKMVVSRLKRERIYWTIRWQAASRWTDYWQQHSGLIGKVMYGWHVIRRNGLAMKLGIDMSTKNVGRGLYIAHAQGIIVNGQAMLGRNVQLTGHNCIGKNGSDKCPCIGNNVVLGEGAKVLGDVEIADDIHIGAGAVVVHSCVTPGATLVGVPAREVKPKQPQKNFEAAHGHQLNSES